MGMVGHAMIYKVIICWCHGSLTNKTKQNKTKQSPFLCGDPTPTPLVYQPSQFLLFINLSPVSSDKFETLGGGSIHIHIHPYRLDGWCPGVNSPKLPAKSGLFQGLKSTSLPPLFLILTPGEDGYRLTENRFSREEQKNNGEKAIPIGGMKAINFLKK